MFLQLTRRQYKDIEKLIESQAILKIKEEVMKQKKKEELISLLKQLNVNSKDLVDAIICGDAAKETTQLEELSDDMSGKDYNCLVGFLES